MIRPVLHYPDPMLKRVCDNPIRDEVAALAEDLLETMRAEKGVGLAAPQIGVPVRMFVVDIWGSQTGSFDKALVFVNPKITSREGKQRGEEGCLSLPGIQEYIDRAQKITVSALDVDYKPFSMTAEGFLAVAIQHENDHLDGVTMLDRMGQLARRLAIRKIT